MVPPPSNIENLNPIGNAPGVINMLTIHKNGFKTITFCDFVS